MTGPMKRVRCDFPVPDDVKDLMSTPMDVITFNFFDPTDILARLFTCSPLAARDENLSLFPVDSDLLYDFCHGGRMRRMHDCMPKGAAVLTAVMFFDEINRDAKGFASGDSAIIVGGCF